MTLMVMSALGHVALEIEKPEGRNGDDHQDEDRDDRPQHLDEGVVGGLGRNRIGLGVELHHHIDEQASTKSVMTVMIGISR